MFDKVPNSTTSTTAVAALTPTERNRAERRSVLYIEDMFDPDKHPIEDKDRYVVPFENQAVLDVTNAMWYRVESVDYEGTLKAKLVPIPWYNPTESNVIEQDWVFGIKGGPQLGEALLAINFSVRPNVARVDSTIVRPGAHYALLYKGGTPGDGKIISAIYDQGGVKQTNRIPTPLAEIVDRSNLEIKTTGRFSVVGNEESLPNGAQCFLAFYDVDGEFIPPGQLVRVQHSAYMRDHQIGERTVTGIRLLAPWFSNSNLPETVIVPINVNLLSLELRAQILYSDGIPSDPLPVNGERFSLEGIQEHRPTWVGQTSQVVLVLKLAPNEKFYMARPGNPLFERVTYTLQAGPAEGAYSPRLFTYPQWDNSINGYRLQHFLYDLDRRVFVDVSSMVTINEQSQAWRPAQYGVVQSMIFNLNLRDVAQTYKSATFKQYTDITLWRDLNTVGKKFDVSFVFDKPTYQALNLKAVNNGASSTANVTNGFTTQAAWLKALYYGVYPSYSTYDEEAPPVPTHFYLMHEDSRKWLYPIADWNKDLPISISMQPGKTWYILWVSRDANGNELQLANTGVTVTV